MNNLQPTLQNDLVRIVPVQKNDFEELYKIASDPLIWEQHPQPDRWKKELFQTYFDEAVQSRSAFVIIDKASNHFIGCTRYYEYDAEKSSIAIGYTFLTRAFWGGTYNSSVKKLLIDYAFQFVNKVIFHVGPNNLRSQMALVKIGAIKTGEWKDEEKPGKPAHVEFQVFKEL